MIRDSPTPGVGVGGAGAVVSTVGTVEGWTVGGCVAGVDAEAGRSCRAKIFMVWKAKVISSISMVSPGTPAAAASEREEIGQSSRLRVPRVRYSCHECSCFVTRSSATLDDSGGHGG